MKAINLRSLDERLKKVKGTVESLKSDNMQKELHGLSLRALPQLDIVKNKKAAAERLAGDEEFIPHLVNIKATLHIDKDLNECTKSTAAKDKFDDIV